MFKNNMVLEEIKIVPGGIEMVPEWSLGNQNGTRGDQTETGTRWDQNGTREDRNAILSGTRGDQKCTREDQNGTLSGSK